jgi:hypothetical protein
MLVIVSRRMWRSAGFDSLASKNDGEIIELKRDISFDEVVVESCFSCGDTFAMVRRKVGYNDVKLPLLVAMRL